MYYSGRIILVDADKGEVVREIELGEQPAASQVRRGEMIFMTPPIATSDG